jgi:hypothetical protein
MSVFAVDGAVEMSKKKTSGIDQFFHRQNCDETFESVCRICLRTAAIAGSEADLIAKESSHLCFRKIEVGRLLFPHAMT